MGIIIGTISTGTIYEFKSQSIKTKFVIIGIPLFPIGSFYKLTDNMGIPIPLNGKSVWVGYSRTTLLAIGAFLVFARGLYEHEDFANVFTSIGVLLLLNGIANWIMHWSLKQREEWVRDILSQSFDYNMLPDYLPKEIRFSIFKELLKKYNTQFSNIKWEEEIENSNINGNNAKLLFSLSYYATQITDDEKYKSALTKIENYIKEEKK